MHRNDWLPTATYVGVSTGESFGAVVTTMCFGKARVTGRPYEMTRNPRGRAILDAVKPVWKQASFLRNWQEIEWYEACLFVHGHPGVCGTVLPDIFDENGNVRPAIARIMERSRRNAAANHGNDTDP